MKGLDQNTFHSLLKERRGVFLYASPVSVEILKVMQPELTEKLKSLPLEVPTLVPVEDKYICVTLVRAGHCPGSVMFLFEWEDKTILYTGDYRIHKNDIKKFNIFKYPSGARKHINKIYLDTTFFYKNYLSFPSRENCIEEICSIVREWTAKSENHLVNLSTSAHYGFEYLFIEISQRIGLPVHIREDEYKFYRCVPEMDKAVTLKSNSTPLHSSCGVNFSTICKMCWPRNFIKKIRVSAMLWTEERLTQTGGIAHENGETRVCFSTHASLEEGQSLIRTLKPDAVEPCVVPKDAKKYAEMMNLINDVMKEYKEGVRQDETICDELPKQFLLEQDEMLIETNQNGHREEFYSALESPPRKRKQKLLSRDGRS